MKFILLLILILLFGCVPSAQDIKGSATIDTRTPTVSIASSTTVAESGTSSTISVSINRTSTNVVTIPFTIYGTATGGTDYALVSGITASTGAITISPGSLIGSKSFTITNDALVEGNETMIIIFGTPTNALMGSNTTQTITIIDDDVTSTLPSVSFSSSFQTATEASGSAISLTANLTGGPATFDVYVPFTVNSTSTCTNLLEYSLSGNNIKIPAGSTNASITVTVIEDTLFEGGTTTYETVIFSMGTPVNAYAGATTSQTLYIYDNESFPSVSFTAATQTVTEANTTLSVNVSLSAASSVPVTVSVAQTGGTASGAGIDYNFTPTTKSLLIPANTLSTTTNLTVVGDSIYEGAVAETVILTLTVSAPAGVTVGATPTQTISITDNESAPVINFNSSTITLSETVGTVNVPITITGTTQDPYTIAYAISGTATGVNGSPADHSLNTATGGTLTISPNSTAGVISFTVVNDNYGETAETILLNLSAGAGYSVGTTSSYAITLNDDDPTPTISFSQPTTSITEGDSGFQTVTLTVSLSNPSGTTVSAIMTESGSATGAGVDYTLPATTITIPATVSSTTVAIQIVGETLYESNETLSLTMGTLTNANAGTYTTHTITISNNDSVPALSFNMSTTSLGEASGSSIIFTTTAAAISGTDITIPYSLTGSASAGTDYNPPTTATGSISIPAGSTTGTLTITPTDDLIFEGTETITLTTLTPTNASGTTTISISLIDDEPTPTVSFTTTSSAITEENTTDVITATLNYASATTVSVPFTVSGTATNGADYVLNAGTIVFPAGSTSQTLNTTIYEDTIDESTESVTIAMTSATGATVSGTASSHAISITDDDVLISFTSASAITSEGAIITMTMQVVDTPTNVAPAGGISGTLTYSGTAVSGTDYTTPSSTFSVTAGIGTTTLAISITQDDYNENAETLNVTMGSLVNAISGTYPAIALSINSSDPVTSMAIGYQHTCVLVNEDSATNHVKCWGLNDQFQTGDADNSNNIGDVAGEVGVTLASINFGGINPIGIAAGSYHSCALMTNGTVRCWGDGTYGQLGNGAAPTDYASPVTPVTSGTAIQIVAGDNHTCILNSAGQVQCWGLNSSGQLGLDNTTTLTAPGAVVSLASAAVQITAGANHTCALLNDYSTLKCWGNNTYGQLGIGSTSNMGDSAGEMAALSSVDLYTMANFGGIASISSGANHVCATSTDASTKVACWGYNGYGQLGQNNTSNYGTSTSALGVSLSAIDFGGSIMSKIKAGGNFTCVINATTNESKCFGENTYGQLGQENTSTIGNGNAPLISSGSFHTIDLPVALDVNNIYLGNSHACAVLSTGTVKCWGYNASGQLGKGNTSTIGDGPSEMGNSNQELNF